MPIVFSSMWRPDAVCGVGGSDFEGHKVHPRPYPSLESCSGNRGSEVRVWRLKVWKSEVGGRKVEVGDWRLEVGGWKQEAGGWRLEIGGRRSAA